MLKVIVITFAALAFVGAFSFVHGQTTTLTPTATPTPTTVVPSGAPSTGFGK